MEIEKIHNGLDSGRCMICHFIENDESELLIQWAGRGEKIRQGLQSGEAFCNHHFWRLKKVMSDDTVAALGVFLLEQFFFELDGADAPLTEAWLRDYQDRQSFSGHMDCPVCGILSDHEREYINAAVAFLGFAGNMPAYEKSRGLCIPHFIKVFLSVRDESQRQRLREIQKSHIAALIHELQEFIKKKDPPLKWERTGDEKIAHWRSLEKLVGRTGTKWR
jgi:hypothetical protein